MSSPPCSDRHLENSNSSPCCEALHNQRQILKGQALHSDHHTISDQSCRIKSVQLITEGESMGKKLNHNAKERIRRRKLTASYFALRSLLPNCRRSKVETSRHSFSQTKCHKEQHFLSHASYCGMLGDI